MIDRLAHPDAGAQSFAPVALSWLHHFVPAFSGATQPLTGEAVYLESEPLTAGVVDFIWDFCATDETGRELLHTEAALVLPKGSAKSMIAAACAVLRNLGPCVPAGIATGGEVIQAGGWRYVYEPGDIMAVADPGGIVTVLATTKEQSKKTCYSTVWRWLGGTDSGASHRLLSAYGIRPREHTTKTAFINPAGSTIAVIAAENGEANADGGRERLVIYDESHRMVGSVKATAAALHANVIKRDGQVLHTSTIFATGEDSLLEDLFKLRDDIRANATPKRGVLIHHALPSPAADLTTLEGITGALGEVYAAAPWVRLRTIAEQFFDPRLDEGNLRRLYLGIPHTPTTRWLDAETLTAATVPAFTPEPGAVIAMGLDASRGRVEASKVLADATGLIGAVLPTGPDDPVTIVPMRLWTPRSLTWQLDHEQLDTAVTEAFSTYTVAGFYADPPYIEQLVAQWEKSYGRRLRAKAASRNHPITWWTNRLKDMGEAIEAYEQALLSGQVVLADHPELLAHHRNAHRRATRSGYVIGKAGKDGPDKIDYAICSVLAYTAAMDAIRAGALTTGRRGRIGIKPPTRSAAQFTRG